MKRVVLSSLLLLAVAAAAAPETGDWPSWRGPTFSGSVTGGGYPTRWGMGEAAWTVQLPGVGGSTPVVWKDRIYLTTPADGQDAVMAVGRDGKQIWLTKLGPESPPRHRSLGSSSNASPVTDGTAVFARFRSGRLAALEPDGTVRWQLMMEEMFGPERLFWDSGSSPVLAGDTVIVSRMHEGDSWVAGFDKATGKQRWLQPRNYRVPRENDNGYTTPILFDYKGRPAFLLWGADHLTAHSAADGSLLWSCGGFNPTGMGFWPAIASPVVVNGIAVVAVGRDDRQGQARVHGIRVDGSGDVTATHRVWQRDDLGVFCCSPAEYGGKVYLLRHRGGVVCLDPATGNTVWAESLPRASSSYYASPTIAGGILYAAREDGTVFTAKVDGGFELLGENPLGDRTVATPVPAGDCMLFRTSRSLFCVSGKKG